MTDQTLGRLERVDLREIWDNEATSFTPWLAKRLNDMHRVFAPRVRALE